MSSKKQKIYWIGLITVSLIAALAIAGCGSTGAGDTTTSMVSSTTPADNAIGVYINSNITAVFSEAMDPSTIVAANFTLAPTGGTSISGTVTYDIGNTAAVFSPGANLNPSTEYTATVTTNVTDPAGNALAADKVWTFETAAEGLGPAPVRLGTAGNFAVLAKAAISTIPASDITGNVGISPNAESYLTGFSQTKHTGYSTSPQVTGYLYAADMTPPTPSNMTTAVSDMEAAYSNAAGRPTGTDPAAVTIGPEIGSVTPLAPGLYNVTGDMTISSNVTLEAVGANDVWIFQIPGNLSVAGGFSVLLTGGAQARNIFWQVAGNVTVGAGAHVEGILLCSTAITFGNLSTMNGRALAQTEVALDQTTITEPTQ